jgi:hypothetical protein
MTAMEALLDGLFDFAGLYPPAGIDLETAVHAYLCYSRGAHRSMLGRFVIDADRVCQLRGAAARSLDEMPLSVCASPATDWDALIRDLGSDARVDAFEMRNAEPALIPEIVRRISGQGRTIAYFEVPLDAPALTTLDAIRSAGARVKLRMGGLVESAFPSALAIVTILRVLAERHLVFKATAGLHHPLRSRHPFTYSPDSPTGTMHGFVNLFCAAALIYLGGGEEDACAVLNEMEPSAWQISAESMACRSFRVNPQQIREVRREFFAGIGSCSFEEPIADLEALGWL